MTREEAIQVLQTALTAPFIYGNYADALNVAIEALQAMQAKTDGDLISRADAIEAIESRQTEQWIDADVDYNNGLESAVAEIKALPSAKRPSGEWIFNPKDAIELMFTKPKCSECGFESSDGGNYCPNCGAKMGDDIT